MVLGVLADLWGPITLPHAVDEAGFRPPKPSLMHALRAWRLRGKRRRYLLRALGKRRDLTEVANRTAGLAHDAILAFACLRNEALRLPHWLDHHRRLGVSHFLVVDNGSDDGSRELLEAQPDVSLWTASASYRAARFGMDWLNHLLAVHGSGHWCLTLDADELFTCAGTILDLTRKLDAEGRTAQGALMIDLYPKGPVGAQSYAPGDDPLKILEWFDPGPYSRRVQPFMQNQWVQGGPRARMFFAVEPDRAPTLNKIPLVRWHWRYAYVNSTHSMLPPRLNREGRPTGAALLHTKFLPEAPARAREEKARGEHFGVAEQYADYYDALIAGPDFWHEGSVRFEDWRQLQELGLG